MKEELINLINQAKIEYANDVSEHTETDYIVECLLNAGVYFPKVNCIECKFNHHGICWHPIIGHENVNDTNFCGYGISKKGVKHNG